MANEFPISLKRGKRKTTQYRSVIAGILAMPPLWPKYHPARYSLFSLCSGLNRARIRQVNRDYTVIIGEIQRIPDAPHGNAHEPRFTSTTLIRESLHYFERSRPYSVLCACGIAVLGRWLRSPCAHLRSCKRRLDRYFSQPL